MFKDLFCACQRSIILTKWLGSLANCQNTPIFLFNMKCMKLTNMYALNHGSKIYIFHAAFSSLGIFMQLVSHLAFSCSWFLAWHFHAVGFHRGIFIQIVLNSAFWFHLMNVSCPHLKARPSSWLRSCDTMKQLVIK